MQNSFHWNKGLADEDSVDTSVFERPVTRSLSFHILILLVAYFYATHGPKLAQVSEPLEVVVESSKSSEKSKPTIVKRSAGEEAEVAKKDSYLSDKTRVVKEELSSKNEGELSNPERSQTNPKASKPKLALSDFGLKLQARDQTRYDQQRNWAKTQLGESLKGGQYIQGMKEGEFSALNTKEFVFYSYFERVRKQLDQAWQPILRENVQRLLKSGRHLASNADFVTRALVTMSSKGEIIRIQVLEESGTQDLDQAAVDALNKAGPYPNPPKGLIDTAGHVEIRWDFILKT